MAPTDFEFTVTLPVDPRLTGVVRQLAVQAAGYAQLTSDASDDLAGEVERATAKAMTGASVPHNCVHVRFVANEHGLHIVISSEAVAAGIPPASSSNGGLTVDWRVDGSRSTCHIRQPIPA